MTRKILCTILALVLVISLMGCSLIESEETVNVTAVVVDKDYRAAYTTYSYIRTGKTTTMIPNVHPERHHVTVEYEDITKTFENEDLYNRVEKGDEVTVVLYLGYDKDGNLLKKDLLLLD